MSTAATMDDLDTLPDAQLDELFSIEVAGPAEHQWYETHDGDICNHCGLESWMPEEKCHIAYCADTNAVMPHLSKRHWNAWTQGDDLATRRTYVGIYAEKGERGYEPSHASTFARAAVIALIRHARRNAR